MYKRQKYGNSMEDVIRYCEEKEERLIKLKDYDNYIETVKRKYEEASNTLAKEAEKLTKKRNCLLYTSRCV